MKVLFAIGQDKLSKNIADRYFERFNEVLEYKDVFFFKALIEEVKRDKSYDAIVISEELEQYRYNDIEQLDRKLFTYVDSITDEMQDANIIYICSDGRTKEDKFIVRLYSIGIYNILIGNDRNINPLCDILKRPKTKREAKEYLNIDTGSISENGLIRDDEIDEGQMINILNYYQGIKGQKEKYVETFDRIASQYSKTQLKAIADFLPQDVKDVVFLEPKYAYLIPQTTVHNEKQVISNVKQINPRHSQTFFDVFKRKKKDDGEIVNEVNIKAEKELKVVEDRARMESEQRAKMEAEQEALKARAIERENALRERAKQEAEARALAERAKQEAEARALVEKAKQEHEQKVIEKENDIHSEIKNNNIPNSNINNISIEMEKVQLEQEKLQRERIEFEEEKRRFEDEKSKLIINTDNDNNTITNIVSTESTESKIYEAATVVPYDFKKIVLFVGANKAGTSFMVNAVANKLAEKKFVTGILDMTKDKSMYYIYNQSDNTLRNIASECMNRLSESEDYYMPVSKYLKVYTTIPGGVSDARRGYKHKTILDIMKQCNNITIVDADFTTPIDYFEQASEIYIVQDLDVLKIQETTTFLREMKNRKVDMSKIRVIVNKYVKNVLTPKRIIEGLSYYKDPEMTYTDTILNNKVSYFVIPYNLSNYVKYTECLARGEMKFKGYTTDFEEAINDLTMQIYPVDIKKKSKGIFG